MKPPVRSCNNSLLCDNIYAVYPDGKGGLCTKREALQRPHIGDFNVAYECNKFIHEWMLAMEDELMDSRLGIVVADRNVAYKVDALEVTRLSAQHNFPVLPPIGVIQARFLEKRKARKLKSVYTKLAKYPGVQSAPLEWTMPGM